jgi:hypothetical protein
MTEAPHDIQPPSITFLTPYWSGERMMRIHLQSIRRFHPDAPILVSRRGGGEEEMESYRRDFGVRYWLEECDYVEALLRLLERAETAIVCILDHDTVLFHSLDPFAQRVASGEWGLVGIEERIREPKDFDWQTSGASHRGWLRFAPGYTDATMLLFDWSAFRKRWGLRGVKRQRRGGPWIHEFHYGICEKLPRHKYLRPHHVTGYGVGNLILDDDGTPILWHQWYGSWRRRFDGSGPETPIYGVQAIAERARDGEAAFLTDYPDLDFTDVVPAWGPEFDIEKELAAFEETFPSHLTLSQKLNALGTRLGRWRRDGWRGLGIRGRRWLHLWRLLLRDGRPR